MSLFKYCMLALGLTTTLATSQIVPSQDPWYTAPSGFESKAPGTILRYRSAPGNLSSLYANASSAYHILYRTTDVHNKASWAVTTLFAPQHPQRSNKTSLASYQIPYNTPYLDASPSYALSLNSSYGTDDNGQRQIVYMDISAQLGNGWFVNVPDFETHTASFGSLVTESQALLDSIRAVFSLHDQAKTLNWAPRKESTRVALWGFSGGSLASEYAGEIQPKYAPELCDNLVGIATIGFVTNLTSTLLSVEGQPFAGLIPSVLVGMGTQHPKLNATLLKSLKDQNPMNSTFLSVEHSDLNTIIFNFYDQNISQYFTSNSLDILDTPEYKEAARTDAISGQHGMPKVPLFFFKSVEDTVAPYAETDALVKKYCAAGANIVYIKNAVGGHVDSQTNGEQSTLDWLSLVLGGKYQHTGCSEQNVNITLSTTGL